MNNLRAIKNSRRKGSYFLGVMGSFLIETLDDDKIVEKLAPRYFNYWRSNSNRHFGPSARLILRNFSRDALVVIRTIDATSKTAELVFFKNHSSRVNSELIEDLTWLASDRWPKGKLITKSKKINKMCPGSISTFERLGWKENNKSGFLEMTLFKR